MSTVANVRVLDFPLTGVQRYTLELLARFKSDVQPIRPSRPLDGVRGHLWEQTVLPRRLGGRLLWSPSNTGPLAVERQVLTVHDAAALDHPEWLTPRFAAWYGWLLPRLVRRVRRVIVPSEFTRDRLVEVTALSPERIVVVPNGVDPRFRTPVAAEIAITRAALGIPSARYVLSLGSMEPRKNLPALLRAWATLHPRLPDDVWLVIAGEAGKRHIFPEVELGATPPRVHLTGRVADAHLAALYGGATVFAYPALAEGFGLPPLEALACGAPVLAANRGALPEVLGDAALLVEPDAEAIADGIERLLGDEALRGALRRAGAVRAAVYTWERTADLTRRALREAADGPP